MRLQAPDGAAESNRRPFLSPHPGLDLFHFYPRLKPWAIIGRCSAASNGFFPASFFGVRAGKKVGMADAV
jgi:hypothetical protein